MSRPRSPPKPASSRSAPFHRANSGDRDGPGAGLQSLVDVCLLSHRGEQLDQLAVARDVDSLRTLARGVGEVHAEPVCAVVESMTGARLVHDTLEQEGWDVEIADAQKVKGLAPLACKTDRIDSLVLAV